jgi:hypothetical protein
MDVIGIGDGPGEGGFTDTADPRVPDDGSEALGRKDPLEPEWALDHEGSPCMWSDQTANQVSWDRRQDSCPNTVLGLTPVSAQNLHDLLTTGGQGEARAKFSRSNGCGFCKQ